MTKLGMPRPSSPNVCPATSRAPLGRDAAVTPMATPTIEPINVARMASSIVTGSAALIWSATGRPLVTEIPKLPVKTLRSHDQNCPMSGWSNP